MLALSDRCVLGAVALGTVVARRAGSESLRNGVIATGAGRSPKDGLRSPRSLKDLRSPSRGGRRLTATGRTITEEAYGHRDRRRAYAHHHAQDDVHRRHGHGRSPKEGLRSPRSPKDGLRPHDRRTAYAHHHGEDDHSRGLRSPRSPKAYAHHHGQDESSPPKGLRSPRSALKGRRSPSRAGRRSLPERRLAVTAIAERLTLTITGRTTSSPLTEGRLTSPRPAERLALTITRRTSRSPPTKAYDPTVSKRTYAHHHAQDDHPATERRAYGHPDQQTAYAHHHAPDDHPNGLRSPRSELNGLRGRLPYRRAYAHHHVRDGRQTTCSVACRTLRCRGPRSSVAASCAGGAVPSLAFPVVLLGHAGVPLVVSRPTEFTAVARHYVYVGNGQVLACKSHGDRTGSLHNSRQSAASGPRSSAAVPKSRRKVTTSRPYQLPQNRTRLDLCAMVPTCGAGVAQCGPTTAQVSQNVGTAGRVRRRPGQERGRWERVGC